MMLVTKLGQAIKFSEKDLRPMGRNAMGVRGVRLRTIKAKDKEEFTDAVVGMEIINQATKKLNPDVLIVSSNGYGKRTPVDNFKVQRRGGVGIKAANVTEKTGSLVGIRMIALEEEDLIVTSEKGNVIRTSIKNISKLGRVTQGVRIMKLADKDKVASIACV
jgi:DNA gyrase subunit A